MNEKLPDYEESDVSLFSEDEDIGEFGGEILTNPSKLITRVDIFLRGKWVTFIRS